MKKIMMVLVLCCLFVVNCSPDNCRCVYSVVDLKKVEQISTHEEQQGWSCDAYMFYSRFNQYYRLDYELCK